MALEEKEEKEEKREKEENPLGIWQIIRGSIIGRAINKLAGPFVDAQIVAAFQEYFPKARIIPHARADVLHIETRLSHVSRKFVHTAFTVILEDPQLDELCLAMEVGGYKAFIFGFTPYKVLWFNRAPDFYLLDIEVWNDYAACLDNIDFNEVLLPGVEPSLPIE